MTRAALRAGLLVILGSAAALADHSALATAGQARQHALEE
eukprot:CAMPEP_0195100654 /NCGR_PEP_ID=MMETSP0448-20130528/64338_1 /TAXON_ID=66468 /ORGANISM="Heterocapsa triquestra, Strain CCMP 448" /LENGTH=39 /DNA_ID= /DNA_START= /DNA_END= /DNA_ORIENTATION=